jgi:AcrR family transcriptional regulator
MNGRRPPPDERRAEILAVAQDLFSRTPYAGVSVADLAEAADIPAPLILHAFGSKRALYLEVLRSTVDELRAVFRAVPGPPSLQRLQASVRVYADHALAHRTGYLSLLRGGGEPFPPEAAELVGSLRAEIAERMAADVATVLEPAVEPSDDVAAARLRVAVRGHLGFVDATVTHWLGLAAEERDRIDADTIARTAVGAFTGALAAVLSRTD